ncbi:hypothetical protein EKO27_g10816 [Xylaria grammica]|uniref:O-methyltransferase C-terminal domain-containing protein n=1 Tax=Xylaria grammica TaxID=363999 RepID=A0A439CQ57_9PEZI|nr:hypothetical protein EKO27_g10816 [Xylaria grammica]
MAESFSRQTSLDGHEAFQLRENIRARAISIAQTIDGPEQAMKSICRGYNTCTALRICLDKELARLVEKYSAVARLPSLLQDTDHRFPSPGKTAYNTVYNTTLDFYSFSSKFDHKRALDYAMSMENLAQAQLPFFERAYPCERLEATTHFIDVAGGLGYTSHILAQRFTEASFDVQDYPYIVEMAQKKCPDALKGRISFTAHDMLLAQPEIDRNLYPFTVLLLKIILHDHCDEECKAILKNLLSAMDKNDRILVIDTVIPEVGGSLSSSFSDVIQLSMFGSGHRTTKEFLALFHGCGVEVVVDMFSGGAVEEFDGMMVFEVRLA